MPCAGASELIGSGAFVVLFTASMRRAEATAEARGSYPRASAVASARRMLAVKRTTNAPLPMSSLAPAQGMADAALTPTLSGVARDRVGGTLSVQFHLRTRGSSTWNVANGARVQVTSGSRASYRVGEGRLQHGTTYEWSVRACNSAGLCAPAGPVLHFTTRAAAAGLRAA